MKELIMKTTICGAALLLSLTMASCEVYESPEINQGLNEENNTSLYTDAYDPISNVGAILYAGNEGETEEVLELCGSCNGRQP